MALNINGTTGISGVDGSVSAPAVTGTGFTVHFKNSSNASIDRNFTYQAVGVGKGG